jgi:hypothetical protein
VPESYWDNSKNEIKGADLRGKFDELLTFHAAEQVKASTKPKAADEYKIELPSDFKAPEGTEFKFSDNDPILPQAKAWALKHGLSQDAFAEALSLYAGAQVGTTAQIKAAREAEVAKLGPGAAARVDNVINFAKGLLGEEGAAAIAQALFSSRQVVAFEKLIAKYSAQGIGNFNSSGRDGTGAKVTEEQWAKMSYGERREYTRQQNKSAA